MTVKGLFFLNCFSFSSKALISFFFLLFFFVVHFTSHKKLEDKENFLKKEKHSHGSLLNILSATCLGTDTLNLKGQFYHDNEGRNEA